MRVLFQSTILSIIFLTGCASTADTSREAQGDLGAVETRHATSEQLSRAEDIDQDFEQRVKSGELTVRRIDLAPAASDVKVLAPIMVETAQERQDVLATLDAASRVTDSQGVASAGIGVEVHIFAIGQADSMLVIGPPPAKRTLLIDVGETGWNSSQNCHYVRDRVLALTGRASVDYLLLSHFHTDHMGYPRTENRRGRVQGGGGAFCLLDGTPDFFVVNTLIDRGDAELEYKPERQSGHQAIIDSTNTWIQNGTLGKRVEADFSEGLIFLGEGIDVEIVATSGKVYDGDDGALARAEADSLDLYSQSEQASPNDFSIAVEIEVGNFEMFTGGDLSGAPGTPPYPLAYPNGHGQIYTNVESHMVEYWQSIGRESNVEVYRVNHHGSQNSSTLDLANALRPELVIYSAGGRHRHPDKDISERFLKLQSDQMLTSEADRDEWEGGVFPDRYGRGWLNPVGDISISIPLNGDHYTVGTKDRTFEYSIYADDEEN